MCKCRSAQNQGVLLEPRWESGHWLGKTWGSNSNRILVNPRKVIECRGLQRVPELERWDKEALNNVLATLARWTDPEDEEEPQAVFQPRTTPTAVPVPIEKTYMPRRVYLAQEHFEKYGYSHNCRRCGNMRQGIIVQGLSHTPACRLRMEQQMRADGDKRILAADRRFNKGVSEQLEGGGGGRPFMSVVQNTMAARCFGRGEPPAPLQDPRTTSGRVCQCR